MVAIIGLLVVVVLSILITRVATIALMHTGLSRDVAEFQSRSALTGAGFTSTESEQVINHPVRRRIIRTLMLVGNAGIVTAVSSLILGFVSDDGGSKLLKFGSLAVGLIVIWLLARSSFIDHVLSRAMERMLERYTDLDTRDYVGLLRLRGNYTISELKCRSGDWLEDGNLEELKLRKEGVLILGIHRASGKYVGAPRGDTEIYAEDVLILYGTDSQIRGLDERAAGIMGDRDHARAVAAQRQREEAQRKEEEEQEHGRKADSELTDDEDDSQLRCLE